MLRSGTKAVVRSLTTPHKQPSTFVALNRCAPRLMVDSARLREGDMQIRSKAYLQFISVWRSLRDLMPPTDGDAPAGTSLSLLYAAVVLALLLTILEIDTHRGELEPTGLAKNNCAVEAIFMSP
jgi:hypothetical protein